jgi:exoribonuclease R
MEKHRLVGELTNKSYQLGDKINVIVEKADIIKREVTLKTQN